MGQGGWPYGDDENLTIDIVREQPVPASGYEIYYFPKAKVQGKKLPRGFGVRVTAGGVRSFVITYRVVRIERRLTIGREEDWSVLRAVQRAHELRRVIDCGQDPLGEKREQKAAAQAATTNSLKSICEEFFRRDGKDLRSRQEREATLKRLVFADLGACPIESIKRSDLVRLLDRIADERGAVMADRTLSYVGRVMNWHESRSDDFRSPVVRGMARTSPPIAPAPAFSLIMSCAPSGRPLKL